MGKNCGNNRILTWIINTPSAEIVNHKYAIWLLCNECHRTKQKWFKHEPLFSNWSSTTGKEPHANECETVRGSSGARTPEADREALSDLIDQSEDYERTWDD
jgi:hypothetical protein